MDGRKTLEESERESEKREREKKRERERETAVSIFGKSGAKVLYKLLKRKEKRKAVVFGFRGNEDHGE